MFKSKLFPWLKQPFSQIKILFAIASFILYGFILGWKLSFIIMMIMFSHELGHLFAMKYTKMKSKGILLIPALGGVTIINSPYKSYFQHIIVSVMGPTSGILCSVLLLLAYFISNSPMLGMTAWLFAIFNLLNLAPALPLDGGHIVKSFLFSLPKKIGIPVFIIIMTAMIILTVKYIGIGWTIVLYILGVFQLIVELFYMVKRNDPSYPRWKIPDSLSVNPTSLTLKECLVSLVIVSSTVLSGMSVIYWTRPLAKTVIKTIGLFAFFK